MQRVYFRKTDESDPYRYITCYVKSNRWEQNTSSLVGHKRIPENDCYIFDPGKWARCRLIVEMKSCRQVLRS